MLQGLIDELACQVIGLAHDGGNALWTDEKFVSKEVGKNGEEKKRIDGRVWE